MTAGAGQKQLLVQVEHVSKKFSKDLKSTMLYGMADVAKIVAGLRIKNHELRKNEFWALSDFSLELFKGEILGIMGVNGAGKTTLIRLITGIYPVDKGKISIFGRISSLYAVNAGMNPLCTGRENVYLRMAMYGWSHEQVNEVMEELIAFAELEEFIDAPLGTYSSGMRARLGFSIAFFSQPDIFIIDEGLAVGDIAFRAKCFKALRDIRNRTATIIVSHSINQVNNMATRIMVLDRGKKMYETDDVADGIDYYIRNCVSKSEESNENYGVVKINNVRLFSKTGTETEGQVFAVDYLDELGVEMELETNGHSDTGVVIVEISDRNKTIIASSRSDHFGFRVDLSKSSQRVRVTFPKIQLKPEIYHLSISVRNVEADYPMAVAGFIKKFQVKGFIDTDTSLHLQADWSN